MCENNLSLLPASNQVIHIYLVSFQLRYLLIHALLNARPQKIIVIVNVMRGMQTGKVLIYPSLFSIKKYNQYIHIKCIDNCVKILIIPLKVAYIQQSA